jgi:hypothetical protein
MVLTCFLLLSNLISYVFLSWFLRVFYCFLTSYLMFFSASEYMIAVSGKNARSSGSDIGVMPKWTQSMFAMWMSVRTTYLPGSVSDDDFVFINENQRQHHALADLVGIATFWVTGCNQALQDMRIIISTNMRACLSDVNWAKADATLNHSSATGRKNYVFMSETERARGASVSLNEYTASVFGDWTGVQTSVGDDTQLSAVAVACKMYVDKVKAELKQPLSIDAMMVHAKTCPRPYCYFSQWHPRACVVDSYRLLKQLAKLDTLNKKAGVVFALSDVPSDSESDSDSGSDSSEDSSSSDEDFPRKWLTPKLKLVLMCFLILLFRICFFF